MRWLVRVSGGVKVKGVDDILLHFSKCCNPVIGDPIVGFITRGRGVSVHRQDCPNVLQLSRDPERRVEIEWAAEKGDRFLVRLFVEGTDRRGLLSDVAAAAGEGEEANGKKIVVAGDRQDVELRTDKALVTRVLGHLVKNALEAERTGATITLTSRATQEGAAFIVRNPAVMPEEARLQVFQRSFSSKGPGRGLGTYGVRLFTEKYLHGKVSFTSGTGGTEFRAEIPAEI